MLNLIFSDISRSDLKLFLSLGPYINLIFSNISRFNLKLFLSLGP
jgi:hypothetical protein